MLPHMGSIAISVRHSTLMAAASYTTVISTPRPKANTQTVWVGLASTRPHHEQVG